MVEFLREKEMKELVSSETNEIARELMRMAHHILVLRVARNEAPPVGDFDLKYFMEIVQDFAREQGALKKILDGKGDELIWMAEDPA